MRNLLAKTNHGRRNQTSCAINKWRNTSKSKVNAFGKLVLTATAVALFFAPGARACGVRPGSALSFSGLASLSALPSLPEGLLSLPAGQARQQDDSDHQRTPLVGMWTVNFYVNGQLWDVAIEQFYSDGNEMTNDIAVPPGLGNICWGIWEKVSNCVYKLKHIGWTFDPNGTYAGRFDLVATLEVDQESHSFRGHFVADQEDLAGNIIPALHAEGSLNGDRFKID